MQFIVAPDDAGPRQQPQFSQPQLAGQQPAAKSWDWTHILENHSPTGKVAKQRNNPSQVFQGLTDSQIKQVCEGAWKNRSKVGTQTNTATCETRIKYRGIDPQTGRGVEFWFNFNTKTVETAYPIPGKL